LVSKCRFLRTEESGWAAECTIESLSFGTRMRSIEPGVQISGWTVTEWWDRIIRYVVPSVENLDLHENCSDMT
jgi:hypothetical protein